MVAINFRKEYADKILNGAKRQTVRKPRADHRPHCQPGDRLQLYVGMRTKGCRKLMDAVCTARRQVVLTIERAVIVDGRTVDREAFARADGFENKDAFFDFFLETHGLPFEGSLIMWSEKRDEHDK